MTTKEHRALHDLCVTCGAPSGKFSRCPDCRLYHRVINEQRRRAAGAPMKRCMLCRGLGHDRRTCQVGKVAA